MSSDYCPSKKWDKYIKESERAEYPSDEELIEELDAYGHSKWVIGWGEEGDERGDWRAYFDFFIHTNPDGDTKIAVQTVYNSESGGFIHATNRVVPVDKAWQIFNLPNYEMSLDMDMAESMWTDEEIKEAEECNERWNKSLKESIDKEETRKQKES